MNTKNTISITEARKKIFQIAKDVQKPNTYFVLTEKGRPKIVIMSAEEFESWEETLEVMKIFPDLDKNIKSAEHDYKTGNYITLREYLAKESYMIADKGKIKYGISSHHTKKSPKRIRKNR